MIKSDKKRKSRNGQKSQGAVPAFLQKTYDILENPEYSDIISWNKEGNAFVVKKINDFAEKVLPKYFKHNNFASFVRQLNMYDFHKARQDNNENEFKHRLFKHGYKQLLGDIKRKTADNLPSPSPNQLVPVNKEFDFEKFKKDCNLFSNEMSTIKTRQGELEKITKVLFTQNNSLVKENKLLWNELLKSKRDKYERKIEKLMYFIFSMMQYSGNPQISSFVQKKGIGADLADALDLGDDSEIKSKLHDETTVSLMPEKNSKDQDKNLKKVLKMFQNKEDPNIEALIDNLPDPNKVLSNYPGILEEDEIIADPQILDSKSKKKGRTKKMTNFEDDEFETIPPKKVLKNEYIEQNDHNTPKLLNGALIEDVPPTYPLLQRGYSDDNFMSNNRSFGGYQTLPLTNGNLESPNQNYANFYPDMSYPRDEFVLEKKHSDDIPYLHNPTFSPLHPPQSPGIKFAPDEDF